MFKFFSYKWSLHKSYKFPANYSRGMQKFPPPLFLKAGRCLPIATAPGSSAAPFAVVGLEHGGTEPGPSISS
jgi:hypothetical protein